MVAVRNQLSIVDRLGASGWLSYRLQDFRLSRAAAGTEVEVKSALARHPLICRAGTSDHYVFAQVFAGLAYGTIPTASQPVLIVDCGANVGYSAAYFLSRFERCRLIALEPDPANYRCLERNLAAYGSRAMCINAALWSHCTALQMVQTVYRDGDHWARQVEESRTGAGATVAGLDIPAILQLADERRISILKIDIEGAEAVVFNHPNLEWLDRVDAIMIELHDDPPLGNSAPIFHRAIANCGFNVWTDGELTICSRLAPP